MARAKRHRPVGKCLAGKEQRSKRSQHGSNISQGRCDAIGAAEAQILMKFTGEKVPEVEKRRVSGLLMRASTDSGCYLITLAPSLSLKRMSAVAASERSMSLHGTIPSWVTARCPSGSAMSEDAMLVWFVLTGLSVVFVSVDIRRTPAHPVLKWAFMILTLFAGPVAAFLYVIGCREPLRGTHETYVADRWRQVLGSTMHCAAGDGLGIIAGAVVATHWHLPAWADLSLEYVLGFGFGWAVFQALAMREMAGGSYLGSLRQTFLPEFLSMNLLMAGMVITTRWLMPHVVGGADPLLPGFWFVMSMAIIVGFILAYPMNWWLVANGLKHGMITVRPVGQFPDRSVVSADGQTSSRQPSASHEEQHHAAVASSAAIIGLTILSTACLVVGIALATWISQ